jgi:hypothetical protein
MRAGGGGVRYIRDICVEFDGIHPWVVFAVEPPAGAGLLFDLVIDDEGPAFVVSDGRGHAEGARLPPVRLVCEWIRLAAARRYFMSRVIVVHGGREVLTSVKPVKITEAVAEQLVGWLTKPKTRGELIAP